MVKRHLPNGNHASPLNSVHTIGYPAQSSMEPLSGAALSLVNSSEFPDSPWERYSVRYKSDLFDEHWHSPWEFFDSDTQWEQPHIDNNTRNKLLSALTKLQQSSNKMPRSRWHLSRSNPATDILYLDVGRNRHNHFCQPFVPTLQQTRNTPETGLPAIDYRIFDSLAYPPETKQKHVEELV